MARSKYGQRKKRSDGFLLFIVVKAVSHTRWNREIHRRVVNDAKQGRLIVRTKRPQLSSTNPEQNTQNQLTQSKPNSI